MAERLFGVETEYAFTALGPGDKVLDRETAVGHLMDLARKKLCHLHGLQSSGLFLQYGARFYVDCGMHPEISTPECANPWDVARYILAGERHLADLMRGLVAAGVAHEVRLFKCNVDYSGQKSTWGCHESFLHRADPDGLPEQILPHLVSRVIYTGAGGFNPLSPGLEFSLSPRVFHLVRNTSSASTEDRGIFHTKDEPLSQYGYHRLHVLCGESLCSETATWLKIGATALVVALIEAGLNPGAAVRLRSPLNALRRFAADPECKATSASSDGRDLSALMIQRHYLALAEAHVHQDFMPPWAERVCQEWRAMLDRLESAPGSVEKTLDWAIKRALYAHRVRQWGMAWESLTHWAHAIEKLNEALAQTDYRDKRVTADFVLGPQSPIKPEVEHLTAYLGKKGLSLPDLGRFLELRQQLFEIDTRFGQVGDDGIFTAMDRAGVLAHRFPGVDNIEHAMENPPAIGRGKLRGECIRRLRQTNPDGPLDRYAAEWDGVWDLNTGRTLDLSDPFATQECWREGPQEAGAPRDRVRTVWFDGSLGRFIRLGRGPMASPDGYRVGERVILGRHDVVNGNTNWSAGMDALVGRTARIIAFAGTDESGCYTARVDLDRGQWAWRTRNLQRPQPTASARQP